MLFLVCSAVTHQPHSEELMKAVQEEKQSFLLFKKAHYIKIC